MLQFIVIVFFDCGPLLIIWDRKLEDINNLTDQRCRCGSYFSDILIRLHNLLYATLEHCTSKCVFCHYFSLGSFVHVRCSYSICTLYFIISLMQSSCQTTTSHGTPRIFLLSFDWPSSHRRMCPDCLALYATTIIIPRNNAPTPNKIIAM